MKKKILFSWSGGKDSALALALLQENEDYEITALLTTITEDYDRASMHGIRRLLIERQAGALGLPLQKVFISKHDSNDEYESKMRRVLEKNLAASVSSVAFGDIFLEDLRKYREEKLARMGMKAIFPIWKRDTSELADIFIRDGFRAITTCIDSKYLDKPFAGRIFNEEFLAELPPTVDPCGENGEFHSFVYDGPIFQRRVPYEKGEVVLRDNRFYFCDLK
jgi:uncharacterized protein (TIGR00290 family)